MRQPCICCRWPSRPGHRPDRHRCSPFPGSTIMGRPSAASRQTDGWISPVRKPGIRWGSGGAVCASAPAASVPGTLLISWDRATIHRSKRLTAFLASGAAKRIHRELLPGYAPELNPDEGIWQYNATNSATSAVPPLRSSHRRSFVLVSASATSARSFRVVSPWRATISFRSFRRGQ